MLGLDTFTRVARELRADLTAALERDPAARDVGRFEILLTYGGVQALLAHRVAHAMHEHGGAAGPAAARQRHARGDRRGDPPRRPDRRGALHRPRHRRRDRRDGPDRRQRDALPGSHARRHRLPARQAPSDGGARRGGGLGGEAARADRRRRPGEDRRELGGHPRRARGLHGGRQPGPPGARGGRAPRGPRRRLGPPAGPGGRRPQGPGRPPRRARGDGRRAHRQAPRGRRRPPAAPRRRHRPASG